MQFCIRTVERAFRVLHIVDSTLRTLKTTKNNPRCLAREREKQARRIPQEWHHDNFFLHILICLSARYMSLKLALESLLCVSVRSVDLPFLRFSRSLAFTAKSKKILKKLFTRNFKQKRKRKKKLRLESKSQHIKNLRVCVNRQLNFWGITKIAQLIRWVMAASRKSLFFKNFPLTTTHTHTHTRFLYIFLYHENLLECGVRDHVEDVSQLQREIDGFSRARLSDCYDIVCEEEVRQWIYGNINTDNDNNVRECKYWNKIFRWNFEWFFINFFLVQKSLKGWNFLQLYINSSRTVVRFYLHFNYNFSFHASLFRLCGTQLISRILS